MVGWGSSRLAERAEVGPPPAVEARRIYLPAVAIVAAAFALIAVGWSSHWGGASFAASMTDQRVVLVGPLTLGILAVILVVERVRPAQTPPARRPRLSTRRPLHGAQRDPGRAAGGGPLPVVRRGGAAALPWIVVPQLGVVPRWGVIAVIFVAMDGCNWLAHLANHRVRVLWRFHELHHSQEDMSVLTVFRTHPLIHVSYLVALIPGDRARGQRRPADDAARRLRGLRRVRALEHQPRLRPAWSGSSSARTTTASTTSSMAPRTSTSASR